MSSTSFESDPMSLIRRETTYPSNNQLIAHAAMASVGFMILLPIGSIIGRYRTINPFWFYMHYACQLVAGILIIPGVGLGINFSHRVEDLGLSVDSKHNRVGLVLFALYFIQVAVGLLIHYVKRGRTGRRPPQNYFHAVLGLLIIGLAFYQVRDGYKDMWPEFGVGLEPSSVNRAWIAMVVVLVVFYVAGLALLPSQYKRETEKKEHSDSVPMTETAVED